MGAALLAGSINVAAEETAKIGIVLPMTGPFQSTGWQANAAVNLFLQQRGTSVAGKKVELIVRDDGGVPDNTKRIAQELVVNDHVHVLLGFGLTPLALAVAPIATEAKIPMIVTVASTSTIVDRSPYIVRTIQTIPQIANVVGAWAAKNGIKSAVSLVSDYAPGRDAEEWFAKSFEQGGGKVLERLHVPLANPDFAPGHFRLYAGRRRRDLRETIRRTRPRQIRHSDRVDERRDGRRRFERDG
jgi:branched-chain amino acid transport system substrate-binding protein